MLLLSHHALLLLLLLRMLLLTLHRHLRVMTLLRQIREVLLMNVALLLDSLLDKIGGALLCEIHILVVSSSVGRAIGRLCRRIVRDGWLVVSLRFDRHIREIEGVLGS